MKASQNDGCRLTYQPGDRVGEEQMGNKLAHIAQFVGLQTMDGVVGVDEDLLEGLHVLLVNLAKPLGQQSKKLFVGSLLSTTVDNHVAKFRLQEERKKFQSIKPKKNSRKSSTQKRSENF
jgi:uncharacterized membrane protein required for colicin V production